MATDLAQVQKKLWDAADELRANSGLQASEYSGPVLGLIFLRFAEERFAAAQAELGTGSARNPVGPDDYKARGVLYLPDEARYDHLLNLPESADLGPGPQRRHGGDRRPQPRPQGRAAQGVRHAPQQRARSSCCGRSTRSPTTSRATPSA